MNTSVDELPDWPRKSALQQMQEKLEHQMRPLRQIQEWQDLIKRSLPDYQLKEFPRTFDSRLEIEKILERSVVPSRIQDIFDRISIRALGTSGLEQYFSKAMVASTGLNIDSMRSAAGLDSFNNIVKSVFSEHQALRKKLRIQSFESLADLNFVGHMGEVTPAFRAIQEARKSLDNLWPTLRNIDLSTFEADEIAEQEVMQATKSITQAAANPESLQQAVESFTLAIQAQQKPEVQVILWLCCQKILDWIISGVISTLISHASPAVLGESPQAAKKAVQENARAAVGSPHLLQDYRYVSAKVLIVRQNPRALSPEIGRLSFGKPVMLLKKEKDFTLILWADKESGAEIQGWVFSRYLNKFN